ncbi:hypothetical protein [Streptomyces atratus]|uniref:hypothetical protein n=1 Tax=Streptomyces atratus TaxID=1893 RepID=UPI00378B7227
MSSTLTRPTNGGGYGGMEDDDNQRGYERDETDQYHRLVRQLVTDGDCRARFASRRARRTLADMVPGYVRQPVLRMTTATIVFAASACGTCGGRGGAMVDTSSDGVIRQHWVSCQSCRGSGVAQ